MDYLYEQVQMARAVIARQSSLQPRVGLILGSGLSMLADTLEEPTRLSYRHLPGFQMTAVAGHRAELALGRLAGQPVAALCGRIHYYEGYTMQQVAFPVRVLGALGCEVLIITNAAGGLRADWQAGDIMCLTDQLFLPGLAGAHPLRGEHDERLGERFPAMVGAFDAELAEFAARAAAARGLTLRMGTYAMVSGPSYESAAELRMLRALGADVVGMSTAPEVVVARQVGLRVLALSLITNLALPDGPPANHAEVLAASAAARPTFATLLQDIIQAL